MERLDNTSFIYLTMSKSRYEEHDWEVLYSHVSLQFSQNNSLAKLVIL